MRSTQNSIIDFFEKKVQTLPTKKSLVFQHESLTFEECNTSCNRIGNHLIQKGLTGKPVGISLNRSTEVLTTILGVLKAGCPYVFIDPAYPADRMQYIVENSEISLLLTSEKVLRLHDKLTVPVEFPAMLLKTSLNGENPGLNRAPESPAYIMYTSGTTGRPKGVVITHGNVVSYIHAISELYDLQPEDRFLHTASFSFSSSVRQYLLPLLHGNTLCMASENQVTSLHNLLKTTKENGISVVDTTQSLWRYGLKQIARLPDDEKDRLFSTALRLIAFSGDLLPASLVQQIKRELPHPVKVLNICGQTESIGALAYSIPADFSQESGVVPVGYPLSNTRIFVLNEKMNQVEDGEIGELYIASPSIGAGYYKNQELSDHVFLDGHKIDGIPFRLLKSGDLIRYWKDKPLEIIGRTDFQVKIRGVRIDINEIESVIMQHPAVKDCIVAGIKNQQDELILVGFLVEAAGEKIVLPKIRQYLKGKLPESFIPERFKVIDSIPVTPNGKIDRNALLKIAQHDINHEQQKKPVVFANETEKILFNLFAKILDRKDFGISESFFDIGGQSLSAVELSELMEKVFNKPVPFELIYQYASVEKLAQQIEKIELRPGSSNLTALQPLGDKLPFVCVHGDDANFFLPRYLGSDIPFFGYFHQGRNGERIRYTSMLGIAEQYTDELLKIRPKGPYVLGGYSIGGVIAFAMVNFIRSRGGEVRRLILIDSESPQYKGKRIPGKKFFFREMPPEDIVNVGAKGIYKVVGHYMSSLNSKLFDLGYQVSRLYAWLGLKVPLKLRNNYIIGIYREARKQYSPAPLNINTILFRSTTDNFEDADIGWKAFISGNLIIREIDSDHDTIIKEPQIKMLAENIREVYAGKV
jgi:amino acid adenylation domain-containing protein